MVTMAQSAANSTRTTGSLLCVRDHSHAGRDHSHACHTHRGWVHWHRVSTTFLTLELWTGFEPQSFESWVWHSSHLVTPYYMSSLLVVPGFLTVHRQLTWMMTTGQSANTKNITTMPPSVSLTETTMPPSSVSPTVTETNLIWNYRHSILKRKLATER